MTSQLDTGKGGPMGQLMIPGRCVSGLQQPRKEQSSVSAGVQMTPRDKPDKLAPIPGEPPKPHVPRGLGMETLGAP